MPIKPQVGRPPELTEEVLERVIDAVPKVMVKGQIAGMAGVPRQLLDKWLDRGERHFIEGKQSIFAQLFSRYHKAQSENVQESLDILKTTRQSPNRTWILEKCYKDDFESKSDAHKKLEEFVFKVIKPMLEQGDKGNVAKAEELHTENAHEKGCTS